MTQTLAALYENFDVAQEVVQALIDVGFQPGTISVIGSHDSETDDMKAAEGATFGMVVGAVVGVGVILIPGIGPVVAAGPIVAALIGGGVGAVAGAVTGGLVTSLVKTGIDEQSAGKYAEAIRRGYTLVVVQTTENMGKYAESTLRRFTPIDLDLKAAEWYKNGRSEFDTAPTVASDINQNAGAAFPHQATSANTDAGDARVRRYNTDIPATTSAIREADQLYEASDSADEPTPLVTLVKEVIFIEDTGDETSVQPASARRKGGRAEDIHTYEDYQDVFHTHYNTHYSSSGHDYSYYEPAYRLGYKLATHPQYQDYEWYQMEEGARNRWEEQNLGTWLEYRNAVRYAWDVVRGYA